MAETATSTCTCFVCSREIDGCAVCEGRCGDEICYRDLMYALKEAIPQPHGHGG